MIAYEKLSEAELDQYLLISFLPSRNDKINFSNREVFVGLIFSKLRSLELVEEFGENLIHFTCKAISKEVQNYELIAEVFCLDMKRAKMAALKTYHEFREQLK